MKLPGWLGKVLKVAKKIVDVAVKLRQAGVLSQKAAPNVKAQGLVTAPTETISHGMAEWAASTWSFLLGCFIAYLSVPGTDISQLWTNPKAFGLALVAFVIARLQMQFLRPGQASIPLGPSKEVKAEIAATEETQP